ncbi:MAG: IS91 family transposase, partial [Bacteroidetes bacterium]|nr:IS91 family transposase [Bacteroidota bacterium]
MGTTYQLGEIFRQFSDEFIQEYGAGPAVCKLLRAIQLCRTPALGGIEYECGECGHIHQMYGSCGNRNCPICPALKKEKWLLKRSVELLDVKYYHVVFTLPHELNTLCANHPRELYGLLFRSAWQSLKELMAEPEWSGGQAGMLAVLHTWGQQML